MIVSVAVAWTKFTVRWRHVLPRSIKSETFVKTNLLNEWKGKIATAKAQSDYLFTVINTGLHDKVDTVSTVIDVATCDLRNCTQQKVTRRWLLLPAKLSCGGLGWSSCRG